MRTWERERQVSEKSHPRGAARDDFERDRARIIHTSAFRRLQGKTQIFGNDEDDFHRTRLTHSMEVAQIGNGIVSTIKANRHYPELEKWLPSQYLIEAICLAHDIGHPPFGHSGEVALNYAMRDFKGFEGNGQTLRVLARLETHTEGAGLNLTRRSLLGTIKYPNYYSVLCQTGIPKNTSKREEFQGDEWHPPKCILDDDQDTLEWILDPFSREDRRHFTEYEMPNEERPGKTRHKSLDCTIMDCADDISYGVHDLEDAIALKLFSRDDWDFWMKDTLQNSCLDWAKVWNIDKVRCSLFAHRSKNGSIQRKKAIGDMVHALINSIEFDDEPGFEEPILKYRARFQAEAEPFITQLKKAVKECVIKSHGLNTLRYRGQKFVIDLFEALRSDPTHLLTPSYNDLYKNESDENKKARVICDYIAGMTDDYAVRIYERLFVPRSGSVFERL